MGLHPSWSGRFTNAAEWATDEEKSTEWSAEMSLDRIASTIEPVSWETSFREISGMDVMSNVSAVEEDNR